MLSLNDLTDNDDVSPGHFHEMDRWAQNSPFGLKTEVTLQKQIEIHEAPFTSSAHDHLVKLELLLQPTQIQLEAS